MGVVALALSIAGFGPGLAGEPSARRGAPTTLLLLHGVVFSLWLLLYLTQSALVGRDRRATHKRLGWVGVPLGLAVVTVGYAATIAQGRRGFALWWHPDVRADALTEMVHPLGDLLTFTLLVAGAVFWRRRPQIHKRLMLLATAGSLMAAPLAHLLGYFPATRAVPAVILLPLGLLYFSSAIRDRLLDGRIHPVSLWGGVLLFGFAFLRGGLIGPSEPWHRLASWLIQ